MGLATRLLAPLPGPVRPVRGLGFGFRLPLRGSPGFAPDSLKPSSYIYEGGTDETQHIGVDEFGQPNKLWISSG
jgi:hypothetical protein